MKSNNYVDLKNIPKYSKNGRKYKWESGIGQDIFGKCHGKPFRFRVDGVVQQESGRRKILLYNYETQISKEFDPSAIHSMGFLSQRVHEFKHKIGDRICNDLVDYTIVDIRRNPVTDRKQYKILCNKCGFDARKQTYRYGEEIDYWVDESAVVGKKIYGCACCSGKIVQTGINDVYTLDKYTATAIGEYYARRFTVNSKKIISQLKCPICLKIMDKSLSISAIHNNHSISCTCSDSWSRLNKMIYWIFKYKIGDVNPEETKMEWFPPGSPRYRYDNCSNKLKIICEGMMLLGHEGGKTWGNRSSISENIKRDKIKKDAVPNDWTYICVRLVDEQYKMENVKNAFINSGLLDIANITMSEDDWKQMMEFSLSNIKKMICDYYNDHISDGVKINEIAKEFGFHPQTIGRTLSSCAEIGLCEYFTRETHKPYVPCFINREGIIKRYKSTSEAGKDFGKSSNTIIKWCKCFACVNDGVWCDKEDLELINIDLIPHTEERKNHCTPLTKYFEVNQLHQDNRKK